MIEDSTKAGLDRRRFLACSAQAGAGMLGAMSIAKPAGAAVPEIVAMDARALADAIRTKRVSCVEVMTAYLDHIDRVNPVVNAIVSLQPREPLLAQAKERDAQLARSQHLGWMHGMPQAVKDLAQTKGIRTTFGSPLFANFVPEVDSAIVERAKRAGAIVIGKTNTPEFGLGSQTYNTVFGTTLNAYDPSRCAGGSSGGAAVAVAVGVGPGSGGCVATTKQPAPRRGPAKRKRGRMDARTSPLYRFQFPRASS